MVETTIGVSSLPSRTGSLTDFLEYHDLVNKRVSSDKTIVNDAMARRFREFFIQPLQESVRIGVDGSDLQGDEESKDLSIHIADVREILSILSIGVAARKNDKLKKVPIVVRLHKVRAMTGYNIWGNGSA